MLAPSLLSADFADLKDALTKIKENGGSVVHVDVMDGMFVPEISYGQPVVRSIRKHSDLVFDIHLMVEHPERQVESFAKAGADWITFHYENTKDSAAGIIEKIHSLGLKAGIAIKPATSVASLGRLLEAVDLVLVMTVEPGFGGQKLIPECRDKIGELVKLREEKGLGYLVSVDGGVNVETIDSVVGQKADVIVSGSAFFSGALKDKIAAYF